MEVRGQSIPALPGVRVCIMMRAVVIHADYSTSWDYDYHPLDLAVFMKAGSINKRGSADHNLSDCLSSSVDPQIIRS